MILFSFLLAALAGQPRITLPKGVSQQTMFRCSFKDKTGNLWFGTTGAGVYKYDGRSFIRYSETEGLASPFVTGITQDNKGNIWLSTNNGVFYSNGKRFNRLKITGFSSENPSSPFGIAANSPSDKALDVYCIVSDKKGNIWFGTEGQGLWCYNGSSCTNFRYMDTAWKPVSKEGSIDYKENGFVSALLVDRMGNIWISANETSLSFYDGKAFHRLDVANSNHHTLQMIEDKSGNIWMATRLDGLCRFNGRSIKSFKEKEGVTDNMASCICEADNGNLWLGSLGRAGAGGGGVKGITMYDGKRFIHIPSQNMRNSQVWTVIEDNAKGIWIGTKEFGLFRYDGKTFTEITSL